MCVVDGAMVMLGVGVGVVVGIMSVSVLDDGELPIVLDAAAADVSATPVYSADESSVDFGSSVTVCVGLSSALSELSSSVM